MNYYRRYVGDYAKKTRHLSPLEHGVYSLLLDTYYSMESPLPAAHDRLCRICGAINEAEQAAVRAIAEEFFAIAADGLRHNARADEEIAIAQPKIEASRENGRLGGRPPKGTHQVQGQETQPVTGKETIQETQPVFQAEPTGGQPSTTNLQPSSTNLQPEPSRAGRAKGPRAPSPVAKAVWEAYTAAYQARYGVIPPRNATVNSQIARFVGRVGTEKAPAIAAWYVESNEGFYVKKKHSVGQLLADAEKLFTEFEMGVHGTEAEARQADSTAATGNVFRKLIDEVGEPQSVNVPRGWWESETGMKSAARALRLPHPNGKVNESQAAFRARINAAIERGVTV